MPPSDQFLKCACPACGGHVEFPAAALGATAPCPHCQKAIPLTGSTRRPLSPAAWKIIIASLVMAVLFAADWALIHFRSAQPGPSVPPPVLVNTTAASTNVVAAAPTPPPDPWHGLKAGPVKIEKQGDGRLVYAVGRLINKSDHERFGVKVELDIFNAKNEKVGTATDYTSSIVPGKEWKFHALIIDRSAKKAVLVLVKES